MKKPKKGSRADIALEFINTQIGFVIRMSYSNSNKQVNTDLKRLLESMRKLKKGLETGMWPGVVL